MAAKDVLKQILSDKGKFADNLVVTLASGETIALGDLRGLTSEQQDAISARETAVATAQTNLQRDLETLRLAQAETARLYAEVSNGGVSNRDDDRRRDAPDPLETLERDPILGPLAKSVRQQQAVLADLSAKQIRPIAEAVAKMAKAFVDDRTADLYDRAVPDDKKGTFTFEAVLRHAADNKLLTTTGIPDIRRAFRDMTTKPMTQADIDSQIAAAEERGRKTAEEAARVRVPRPGLHVTGTPEAGGFKPKHTATVSGALEEAIAAAAKDASIWAQVDGVS